MRRLLLVSATALVVLALAASCSSSSGTKAQAADPAGAASAQGKATCASVKQLDDTMVALGVSTPDGKTAAAQMKAVAATIIANPPKKVAADAQAAADSINKAADRVQTATTKAQVYQALGPFVFNTDKSVLEWSAWVKTNCK